MLGTRKDDGSFVALIPDKWDGYYFFDKNKKQYRKVDKSTEKLFNKEAMVFYKPFPLKKLSVLDLVNIIKSNLRVSDIFLYVALLGIITVIGMILPKLNNMLFGDIITLGNNGALIAIGIFMVCVSISMILFSTVQSMIMDRISIRINIMTESATMMRVLSLPPNFFREYSSGELSARVSYMTSLVEQLLNMFLSTTLTSVFSLVYLTQVFEYAPSLVIPSIIITVLTIITSIATTLMQRKITQERMEVSAKERGINYGV